MSCHLVDHSEPDLGQDRLVGGDDISVEAVVAVHDRHLHERVRAHLVLRDETLAETDEQQQNARTAQR